MNPSGDTAELSRIAPAGFFIALRVAFAFPMLEKSTFCAPWVERYRSRGLLMNDPVMHWLFQNTGTCRWSDIRIEDPRGVFEQAREFGLNFGVAICCADPQIGGQRSFGSFARGDREFDDAEITDLEARLGRMHAAMAPPKNLTKAEIEALRLVKNGLLMKEIANMLDVSEGAVKQRLRNAKTKLGAKTGTQAATLATSFGLI